MYLGFTFPINVLYVAKLLLNGDLKVTKNAFFSLLTYAKQLFMTFCGTNAGNRTSFQTHMNGWTDGRKDRRRS